MRKTQNETCRRENGAEQAGARARRGGGSQTPATPTVNAHGLKRHPEKERTSSFTETRLKPDSQRVTVRAGRRAACEVAIAPGILVSEKPARRGGGGGAHGTDQATVPPGPV